MPNAIKYNTNAETLALKKGNFWIGTGDVGKGPTSSTGFYNGITPPSGGYTIYLNKASGGPSIYTVTTEAQMVSLTNSIGSQSFTTSGQCLNWFATQTDKMIFNRDYEPIVTNGLVLNLDAGFTPSYPTTNTTWYDVSSAGNNGTLINGPTYNSANGGSIVFDGVDDYASTNNFSLTQATFDFWFSVTDKGSGFSYVMSYGNDSVGGMVSISIAHQDYGGVVLNRELYCYIGGGGDNELKPTGFFITYGSIYNVVLTVTNSSSVIGIYVNGINYPVVNSDVFSLGNTFNIGRWLRGFNNLSGKVFTGKIYNRVLTQAEVTQNYNAQKGRFGL